MLAQTSCHIASITTSYLLRILLQYAMGYCGHHAFLLCPETARCRNDAVSVGEHLEVLALEFALHASGLRTQIRPRDESVLPGACSYALDCVQMCG